jgi:hypothetical protein
LDGTALRTILIDFINSDFEAVIFMSAASHKTVVLTAFFARDQTVRKRIQISSNNNSGCGFVEKGFKSPFPKKIPVGKSVG